MAFTITARVIFTLYSIPITLVSLFWIGVLTKHLIQTATDYKLNKKKFFPDEFYRKSILYNLETHIVKDTILLILVVLELIEPLSGVLYVYNTIDHNPWYINIQNATRAEDCSFIRVIELIVSNNLCIQFCNYLDTIFLCQCMIGICVFMTLLSILCRYLAARYNRHPVHKTVRKYVLWLCAQIIIHIPGLTKYTLGVTVFISVFIMLIDWLVLVRDSIVLRNALRLHIQELQLHFNRRLYLREKTTYNTYRGCMIILLASLLCCPIALAVMNILHIGSTILTNECISSLISVNNPYYQPVFIYHVFFKVVYINKWLILSLHFALLTLPLHLATLSTLIAQCIKKCRGVNKRYIHFNHEIMQTLLEKQKQRN